MVGYVGVDVCVRVVWMGVMWGSCVVRGNCFEVVVALVDISGGVVALVGAEAFVKEVNRSGRCGRRHQWRYGIHQEEEKKVKSIGRSGREGWGGGFNVSGRRGREDGKLFGSYHRRRAISGVVIMSRVW